MTRRARADRDWTDMPTSEMGTLANEGFRRLLRHPALRSKPFILETPHDEEDRADLRDIATLKRLAGPEPAPNRKQASQKKAEKKTHVGKGIRFSGDRK